VSIEALNYVRLLKIGNRGRKLCLLLIADRADENFSCFPAVGLLAAECEVSERQIQLDLAWFRENGFLSDRERWRSDGSQTSSRYFLHGPWDNFGGTGRPFAQIITPKEVRAERWAKAPAEGEFRDGTVAARPVLVKTDISADQQGVNRDAEACTASSGFAPEMVKTGISAGQEGVKSSSPPGVKHTSPHPLKPASPLEPPVVSTNTNDAAPVGRVSAPDARRASTGSSARAMRSGSAAPRKTSPARMDKRTAVGFRTVVDALPADLRHLADRPLPVRVPARPLGELIREQLGQRSPEQLVERIGRRWIQHRWEEKCRSVMAGEPLRSGVGIAVELLKAPECSHPRCEDGTDVDTKMPCRVCPERQADFRRAWRSGGGPIPPQAPGSDQGPAKWWCVTDGCGYNSYGSGPADGLCADCRAEQELGPIDPAELAEVARVFAAAGFGSGGEE
jgi:hypothetical protein